MAVFCRVIPRWLRSHTSLFASLISTTTHQSLNITCTRTTCVRTLTLEWASCVSSQHHVTQVSTPRSRTPSPVATNMENSGLIQKQVLCIAFRNSSWNMTLSSISVFQQHWLLKPVFDSLIFTTIPHERVYRLHEFFYLLVLLKIWDLDIAKGELFWYYPFIRCILIRVSFLKMRSDSVLFISYILIHVFLKQVQWQWFSPWTTKRHGNTF